MRMQVYFCSEIVCLIRMKRRNTEKIKIKNVFRMKKKITCVCGESEIQQHYLRRNDKENRLFAQIH